jgi:hypothetical protein
MALAVLLPYTRLILVQGKPQRLLHINLALTVQFPHLGPSFHRLTLVSSSSSSKRLPTLHMLEPEHLSLTPQRLQTSGMAI